MKPVEVFFSYARKDEDLRNRLMNHLSTLHRDGLIKPWHDHQIDGGQEWASELTNHLNSAQIILLLISADFLAADNCGSETARAMERHTTRTACVIPIILRPVDWEGASFSNLKVLPRNGKPITSWTNQDEAFADVAKGIRAVVEELNSSAYLATHLRNSSQLSSESEKSKLEEMLDTSSRTESEQLLLNTITRLVNRHLRQILLDEEPIDLCKTLQLSKVNYQPFTKSIGSIPDRLIEDSQTIFDIYNYVDISGKLLIIGASGAGKTTCILQLAQILVAEAKRNINSPIPLAISLSKWRSDTEPSLDRNPFRDWLVREMDSQYGIDSRTARDWIDRQTKVIFLLDGLNEVSKNDQLLCLREINKFITESFPQYLVVSTSSEEYNKLPKEEYILLNGAVSLNPLTVEQIKVYLKKAKCVDLWNVFEQDLSLLEVVRSPLLLKAAIVSRDLLLERLPVQVSAESLKKEIWTQYIKHRMETSSNGIEKLKFLKWLANRMENTSYSDSFLPCDLQAIDLTNSARWLYSILTFCITGAITAIVFLISSLFITLPINLADGWIYAGLLAGLWSSIQEEIGLEIDSLGFYIEGRHQLLKFFLRSTFKPTLFLILYLTTLYFSVLAIINTKNLNHVLESNFSTLGIGLFLIFFIALQGTLGTKMSIMLRINPGLSIIRYLTIRLILVVAKNIPWDYEIFFQEMINRGLMKQSERRYKFYHAQLQEYFISDEVDALIREFTKTG